MPRRTVKQSAIDPRSPITAALISAIRLAPKRGRKKARTKVVEAVPSTWANEDYVLTRLKRAYDNAQGALDAYVRRTGDPVALAPLTNSRDAARAALTQYLDTQKRKP